MTASRITLTADQRHWLDTAVHSAIARTPGGRRSLGLEYDQYVAAVIKELPPGKKPYRYVDGSLQRLRLAKRIEFGGMVWVAKGGAL